MRLQCIPKHQQLARTGFQQALVKILDLSLIHWKKGKAGVKGLFGPGVRVFDDLTKLWICPETETCPVSRPVA